MVLVFNRSCLCVTLVSKRHNTSTATVIGRCPAQICGSLVQSTPITISHWTGGPHKNRYEIGCQLLLISNRKSHTGFRLVPNSMTLNDLGRRNSAYFAFSPNLIAMLAKYVTVIECRPIMSINVVPQFQSSTFGHN